MATVASGQSRVEPVGRSRLPSLTGMRFLAALVVFGFHVGTVHWIDTGPVGAAYTFIVSQGATGVSFFFILSGFVLTWSARPNDTVGRFWQRRFAKIYPNHLVTLLVAIGLAIVTARAVSAGVLAVHLLLLQAWVPDSGVFYALNTVSWSLSCEVFFYLLFPWLRRWLARIPGQRLWGAAAVALAAVWLVPLPVQLLPQSLHYWAIWILPVARLPEFIAGMLLARIVLDGRWRPTRIWPIALVAVAAFICVRWLPEDLRIVAGTAVPFALLIAAIGAADAAGRPTWVRSRTFVRLGEASYAFYLVHHLMLRLMVRIAGADHSTLVEILLVLLTLGLTLVASFALYRIVERPAMTLVGRRYNAQHGRLPRARATGVSGATRGPSPVREETP